MILLRRRRTEVESHALHVERRPTNALNAIRRALVTGGVPIDHACVAELRRAAEAL